MKRNNHRTLILRGLILLALCGVVRQGAASSPLATLKALSVSAPPAGNELQLRIDGDYSFKAVQATADTLFIDLTGVQPGRVARNGAWSGGLLTSYRLQQFTDSTGQPVVRVEVEMKHHQAFQARRTNESLCFTFGDAPMPANLSQVVRPTPLAVMSASETKPVQSPTPPAKRAGGNAEVSGVSISAGPQGEVFVDVATTQPTPFRVTQLSDPRRLVIDLDGAHQALDKKAYSAQSPLLSGVRIGQFRLKNPAVVRVVADLSGEPVFDVHSQPGGIRIQLKSPVSASHRAAPVLSAAAPSASKVTEKELLPAIAQSQLARSATAVAPRQIANIVPAPPTVRQEASKAEPIALTRSEYQNALPATSGSKEVAAAPRSESPQQTLEAAKAANAAQVLTASLASEPQSQGQVVTGPTGPFQSFPTQSTPGMGSNQVRYGGEPISLNLKDIDLKDFFRLIHEISGLNILVDPDVSGSVTMVLDNVPWDQALDMVLKNNGLGKSLDGNVLRISRIATLTAEQESAIKLVSARDEAQPLVTRFIPVNYAKALELQRLLKSWVGGGALSKRGNILVDERSNTLIISDIASQIPVILSIVQKLDTKSKQVSIEARVIVASKNFERDISGALNNGLVNKSGTTVTGISTGTGASAQGLIPKTTAPGAAPSTRVTLGQTSAAGFGAFVINNQAARYFINGMIAAAEITSQAKTISKPVIVTQNNVPGTIVQGVKIPIQTTINNTISVVYVNAALTMTVTPQVTADGNIFMNITIDNSSVGALSTLAGPSINTQSATTQVLVPDGGTVIFGGVTVNGENKAATYVPLIGQIPIIGHLFKTSTRTTNNSQLIFFVSPKILPG